MMITFFAVTYFLCTFLISVSVNSVDSDIISSFSDKAEMIIVQQDNNSENALTYSDTGDVLSRYKAAGAVKLVTEYSSGYALFDYGKAALKNSGPTAVINRSLSRTV